MSSRTRMLLAVVVALLVAAAFFFFFIRPRQQDLADVNDSIDAERARTATLQAELARLEDLQARAPELEAELAKIRQLVPREHQVPNFIFLVQDAANAAGVSFVNITPELPKPPPEGAALAEVRATVGAGGSYFSVQDFLRRLHNLDRAVRVDNLAMNGAETEGVVRITLSATVRIFFETPAAPEAPAASPSPSPTA